MKTTTISAEIDQTLKDFIRDLSSVGQEQINTIPFKDSWTAGELAQHVLLSVSGFTDLIYGPVKETDRAPDLGVETLKRVFLDFSTKMKSPEFIVPPAIDYTKGEQVKVLEEKRKLLIHASETLDLTKTCTAFELPKTGFITRLEALYFVLYHTQRHTHQLKNIRQHLIKS